MRKFLVIAAVAMMTVVNMNAQGGQKNEIGVFYGTGSASNLLSVYTEAFAAAVGKQSSWWGPIGVEYYYHVSPVVGFGAVAAYASCKAENENTHKSDFTERFITVMPSVKFN